MRLRGGLEGLAPEAVAALARELGIPEVAARLLIGRDVQGLEAQRRVLNPKLGHLRAPAAMAGFSEAVDRLLRAWKHGETVGVFGDYDVDGVTTATILSSYLEALGVPVVVRVADRSAGYGFTLGDARKLHDAGATVVTVGDCGTSDHEAVGWLRERDVDVIVVDHHQVPESASPATALINPHQVSCGFPFKGLCSAGVAFYLCAALRTRCAKERPEQPTPDPRAWLDLVALATVCDMVPLREENRVLLREGLERLRERKRPGVRALLKQAAVSDDDALDEETIGFRLGPRLNAPGRLGPAEPALRLLRSTSLTEATALAEKLESINAARRACQADIEAQAREQLAAEGTEGPALVVAREGWQAGVVGIAANALSEEFRRPVAVLAIEGDEARGSIRAGGPANVHAALQRCADLLTRFGGHPAAAGLSLPVRFLADFRAAFCEAVGAVPRVESGADLVDGQLELRQLEPEVVESLDALGPFGTGFPEPRFWLAPAQVRSVRVLKERHLALTVEAGGETRRAIGFGLGASAPEAGARVRLAGRPTLNHYRGRTTAELRFDHIEVVPEPGAIS